MMRGIQSSLSYRQLPCSCVNVVFRHSVFVELTALTKLGSHLIAVQITCDLAIY